uniref:AlNc14C296G10303 protein n=1 Tax=Albugo laibachii Nc14 TaxID=890382 RepID=F0WVG8_9STRA|nr:AlNc14C296G10303 [Albugo laibachii Nc14]|eukprot:CCA25409.1 AlNc14C296G10303 [Albugo laibachii Nc14]
MAQSSQQNTAICYESVYTVVLEAIEQWMCLSSAKYVVGMMVFAQLFSKLIPTTFMTILWYGALVYLFSYHIQNTSILPATRTSPSLTNCVAIERRNIKHFTLRYFHPGPSFHTTIHTFTITLIQKERDQHFSNKSESLTIFRGASYDSGIKLVKEAAIEGVDFEDETDSDTGDECDQEASLLSQDTESVSSGELETFDETLDIVNCLPINSQFRQQLYSYEPLTPKATTLSPAVRQMIAEADVMMAELRDMLLVDDLHTDDALFVEEEGHFPSRKEAFETMYDGDDEEDTYRSRKLCKQKPQWVRFDPSVTVYDAPDEFYL